MIRPTIQEVLSDPAASYWLKNALTSALSRDCIDAAADADLLSALLTEHAHKALGLAS